ncbi:hypothetical protein AB4090_14485 [Acidithiobacillus sp. IBUN Pt1247-S3]|uniref:hypothetical protein n=1 Tax=Acidithiobacillus sp. IBUN Pt1247-S3 TaxID=3166642 RepID=UPI0034E4C58F
MTLKTQRLQTLDQIRAFVEGAQALDFAAPARDEAYDWIGGELRRFQYLRLGKVARGWMHRYLEKVTGLSRAQVTRLITQFRAGGQIRDRRGPPSKPFPRRYTAADVQALVELDALHDTLSGPATRKLCERAYRVFHDARYERLATISHGHLYNLRHSQGYQRQRGRVDKTRPVQVAIGERRKPHPGGRPGFLRVDSVHQGDLDGIKGLYHINLVDEVTQFQFVGSVERISERFLLPVLEALIDARGRLRKRYPYAQMMTPYDKLKSLDQASQYLKQGVNFAELDAIAYARSDNDAALCLQKARAKLFRSINNAQHSAA